MRKDVLIYDTTLRDGAQTEGISFTVEDKVKVALKLDELGVDYVEGGWPHPGNATDLAFFPRMAQVGLRRARLAAFVSTRRARSSPAQDASLQAALESGAPVVTVFGKSWDLHVTDTLRTTTGENLHMIKDSVAFLAAAGREVIYDAEHFFDGYRHNPDYALETVAAAAAGGAQVVVLCDTNGGLMPWELAAAVRAAQAATSVPLGIHAHNDCDLAVALTLEAVRLGITHVQGTINGYGERCGNANLCSLLPNLQLKLGKRVLAAASLRKLYQAAHYVAEVANQVPAERQPFVGRSAFAHKAGVHVDAVMKRQESYEHIRPELVGNQQRLIISHQAGSSAVVAKARALGVHLERDAPETERILAQLKQLEASGYQFEGAEASFELLVRRATGDCRKLFDLEGFRVIVDKRAEGDVFCEATIKVRVDGREEHTAAEGDGPVHALDGALRKALEQFYPELAEIKLTDFKVRVLDSTEGTAAKVRVLLESRDEADSWSTTGVHTNIIEASWEALVDSVVYGLLRKRGTGAQRRRKRG